ILLIGVLTSMAPTLDSVKSNDNDNPPLDSMSMRADRIAQRDLDADASPPAIIVIRSHSQATTAEATTAITKQITAANLSHVSSVSSGQPNPDGTAQAVAIKLSGQPSQDSYRDTVDDLRTIAAKAAPDDVEVAVT